MYFRPVSERLQPALLTQLIQEGSRIPQGAPRGDPKGFTLQDALRPLWGDFDGVSIRPVP